jgi:hypothetical protein
MEVVLRKNSSDISSFGFRPSLAAPAVTAKFLHLLIMQPGKLGYRNVIFRIALDASSRCLKDAALSAIGVKHM